MTVGTNEPITPVNLDNWLLIHTQRDLSRAVVLVSCMCECSRKLGMLVSEAVSLQNALIVGILWQGRCPSTRHSIISNCAKQWYTTLMILKIQDGVTYLQHRDLNCTDGCISQSKSIGQKVSRCGIIIYTELLVVGSYCDQFYYN